MKKNKIILLVSLLLIITAAYMAINTFVSKSNAADSQSISTDLGIPVELISAEKRSLQKEIAYLGTVKAINTVTLTPKITSQITEIKVKEGDSVKKGDIIARLDNSMLKASLDTAVVKLDTLNLNYSFLSDEVSKFHVSNPMTKKIKTLEVNYDFVKAEEENYRKLFENGAISQNAYDKVKFEADIKKTQLDEAIAASEDAYSKLVNQRDTAKLQMKELQANINQLRISLKDTELISPITGKVRFVYYSTGDLAVMGKPLAVIDEEKGSVVSVSISEQDIKKIQAGSRAIINITGNGKFIETRVSRILPNINANTRIGEVELTIPDEFNKGISAGTSTEVRFITAEANEAVVISKSSIKRLKDKDYVYVIDNGAAYERLIETGLSVGNDIQVIKGLAAGEKIAKNNLSRIYDGAKVYILGGEADQ